MSLDKILEKLQENKKAVKIGGEVFNVEATKTDIKPGRPFKEIIKEMKKASKEGLFRNPPDVTYS